MWCSTCQQDVPGLGSPRSAVGLCCGKCGELLAAGRAVRESDSSEATAHRCGAEPRSSAAKPEGQRWPEGGQASDRPEVKPSPVAVALIEEDWALEAELRTVERLISSLHSAGGAGGERDAIHRLDLGGVDWPDEEAELQQIGVGGSQGAYAPRSPTVHGESQASKRHLAGWAILSIGLAMLACGSVLLIWSLVAGRHDLWPKGMPLAMIGQAGLILGFILQLDVLWNGKTERVSRQRVDEATATRQASAGRAAMRTQARRDTLQSRLASR